MEDTYYFAIGRYTGSYYNLMPDWTHYILTGTEDEVKKMYAKYFILDNEKSGSFRDYVKNIYEDYENYKGEEITDDMIMDFLNTKHFNIASDQYNDGWKKLKDLTEMELCKELVSTEPVSIEFDDEYTFDDTY